MNKIPDLHKGLAAEILSQNGQKKEVYQSQYSLKKAKQPNAPFLSPRQLAIQLGYSEKTLQRWRKEGKGPKFFKIMNKRIRYYLPDVDAWLRSAEINSDTS